MEKLLSSIAATLLLFGGAPSALAQTVGTPPPSAAQTASVDAIPEVHVAAGAVFEILAVTATTSRIPTWTLRQGETLLDTRQTGILRARFVEAGTYTLLGSVAADATHAAASITIPIRVTSANPPSSSPLDGSSVNTDPLITTLPATEEPDRTFDPATKIVTVIPNTARLTRLAMDLDSTADTDGDGDLLNDDDTAQTLSHTSLDPLHLWFADAPSHDRTISMMMTLQDGRAQSERLFLPMTGGEQHTSLTIQTSPLGSGDVRFAVNHMSEPGDPQLIEWSFGDGSASLLDQPTHTYATNGTYEVHVTVRSLISGRTIASGMTSIAVTDAAGQTASSATSSTASSAAPEPSSGTGGLLSTLRLAVIIIVIIVLIALVFSGLLWLVMRIVRRSQKRMDRPMAEHAPPTKTPQEILDAPVTPLTLRPIDTPTPQETARAPDPATIDSAEPVPPKPIVTVEEAPAWLKQGLEKAEHVDTDRPAQAEAPASPEATPTPLPTPTPAVPPADAPLPQQDKQVEQETLSPTELTIPAPDDVDLTQAPAWLQEGLGVSDTLAMDDDLFEPEQEEVTPAAPPRQGDVSPVQQSSPATGTSAAETEARAAAERERKRRKRQRYRENLRKRELEAKQKQSTQIPPEPEPRLPPATPTEAPTTPIQAPVIQTPAPLAPKPVPQDIPPATPQEIPPAKDDDVKFIIKAEDIEQPMDPTDNQAAA